MSNQLICPTCSTIQSQPSDVDLINVCSTCGTEFYQDTLGNIHIQQSNDTDLSRRKRKRSKPPPGITSIIQDGQLVIVYRWLSLDKILTIILVTVGLSSPALVLILDNIPTIQAYDIGMLEVVAIVVAIFVISIPWLYYLIAQFVNSTIITVSGDQLTVRYRPLPWFPLYTIPVNTIKDIYVAKKEEVDEGRVFYHYHLKLNLENARTGKKLLSFSSPEMPQFIKREIQQYLHIADEPVFGKNARVRYIYPHEHQRRNS